VEGVILMEKRKLMISLVLLAIVLIVFSSLAFAMRTFVVEETDLVSLSIEANDPDSDEISYNYTSPLNENGEWQTGYDDAGEYLIDIYATDGQNVVSETVKIIVVEKNRVPIATIDHIYFKENDIINITEYFMDPDGDELNFRFQSERFDESGKWHTDYDDAGEYNIKFVASDGKVESEINIIISIEETNQPPTITSVFSDLDIIEVAEDDTFEFSASAADYDSQEVTFEWRVDGTIVSEEGFGEKYFSYEDEGEHILLLTISDGELKTERTWVLDVMKKNRRPRMGDLQMSVYETEIVTLDLPKKDIDGDKLTYELDSIFDEFKWQTGYEDSGNHTFRGIVSDGLLEKEFEINIEVLGLDRAPKINEVEVMDAWEGSVLEWTFEIEDPDGDILNYELNGLPDGATFDMNEGKITWDVPYEYVQRRESRFTNYLNLLRVEHQFLDYKESLIEIDVCGENLCSQTEVILRVHNTNRAPEFVETYDQYVDETGKVAPFIKAIDPDGDIVQYSFSEPLGKDGIWKTGYNDEGEYVVAVSASDGYLNDNEEILIVIANNNRLPELEIKDDKIKVKEGQEVKIKFKYEDADNDNLLITVKDAPSNSELNLTSKTFTWTPDFDTVNSDNDVENKGIFTQELVFEINDGKDITERTATVIVRDVNRLSVIKEVSSLEGNNLITDVPVKFFIEIEDLDNDELSYTWSFSGFGQEDIVGSDIIMRTFKTSGEKWVKVVVSDGFDTIEHKWEFVVEQGPKQKRLVLKKKPVVTSPIPTEPEMPTYGRYVIEWYD
jgi:hypothetical protein